MKDAYDAAQDAKDAIYEYLTNGLDTVEGLDDDERNDLEYIADTMTDDLFRTVSAEGQKLGRIISGLGRED